MIVHRIRRALKSLIYLIPREFSVIKEHDYFCLRAKVTHLGYGSIKKIIKGWDNNILIEENSITSKVAIDITGGCNRIRIGKNSRIEKHCSFHIVGSNNVVEIGNNCNIGPFSSFWMEGNGIKITIGSHTTFTEHIHLNAQEANMSITLGDDCMISNHIIIRTSDSHPIYDMESQQRINKAKPIIIGSHVWIAPDSKIMKGSVIGDGCIIGSNTMVNKKIPLHCLAVGMPAKVIKENVTWTRDDVLFH